MENNRTIIAIVLIVLLWSGYSLFFAPQRTVQQPAVVDSSAKAENKPISGETGLVPSVAEKMVEPPAGSPQANVEERIITIESDLYKLKLSTVGASLRTMALKQYRETNDKDAEPYILKEMGPENVATFQTSGSDGFSIPTNLPYQVKGLSEDQVQIGASPLNISFTAALPSGLVLVKNYTFYPDSYQVDVSLRLTNGGAETARGVVGLSLVMAWDDSAKFDRYTFAGPLTFDGEDLQEDNPKDLAKASKTYGSAVVWSGYTNKYFLMILSPLNSAMKQLQVEKGDGFIKNQFNSPPISLATGESVTLDYVAFLGPKEYDILQGVGHQFERAIDYGFFRILAHPLMVVLKFFYGFVGNYGIAIILLTICIKIIFWPLTQKSYASMKGMQTLQPEMQKLREKFANDKQRLNQEMMAFYKENRVNPLGGCLPMVIQIPVFFALYKVLLGSIELRHAPFAFWINDLSAADTLFTHLFGLPFTLGPLPLIMGFTMFLQQKMTPTNMDPTQAKIMNMMPVVFTFLFLSFPSGLVIYWLVNNLLTILQQYLIRRQPN